MIGTIVICVIIIIFLAYTLLIYKDKLEKANSSYTASRKDSNIIYQRQKDLQNFIRSSIDWKSNDKNYIESQYKLVSDKYKEDTILVNVDKIKGLAKDKGVSITHLCAAVGQGPYYLNDVKKKKCKMPLERLSVIADILDTTVEYLSDKTDNPHKEKKPSFISDETWNKIKNDPSALKLLELILNMSQEQRDKFEKFMEEL